MSISKLRIGKDITIKMSILTNGEPVSLDGRDISVVLKTPMCQEVKLNFTIEDNIIISKYEGTKQKYCGIYMLTVWENYGKIGQSALDFCNAFELVSNTCKEVPTSEGLEIETITLEGDLSIGIQGASAYEVAVANGFKGTETEWLEWLKLHYNDLTAEEKAELQKPITDIAADVAEAERQRQQAEEIRRSAEVHRTGEEEKRVTAEDGRKTAEDARVTAETERVSAEVLRGEAEVIRAEAETSRVTAESKRSEAEAQRMTGEDLRKVAEQNRTTAEQARVSAEAERVKAESARVTAEQQRAEAEQARTEAEQQRNTAEAQRIGAEISRTEAEVQRAAAEQQRAEAEQSRVAAEANRQQQTTAAIEAAKTATASATSATAEAEKAVTAATNATTEASEAAKLATDTASKTSTVDYAVCTTAATIADKEINIAGFALGTHCRFLVKMSHIAETEDVKLSVRSGDTLTEPKPLTFNGAPASVNNTWRAGDILDIYYDGSNFHATHYMGGYGITEINVSEMCPKGGHNGTNKYTLAEAIKKIPEAHQRVGFKCSFINDNGEIETAVYQGGTWNKITSWYKINDSADRYVSTLGLSSFGFYLSQAEVDIINASDSISVLAMVAPGNKAKPDWSRYIALFNTRNSKGVVAIDCSWNGRYIIFNNSTTKNMNSYKQLVSVNRVSGKVMFADELGLREEILKEEFKQPDFMANNAVLVHGGDNLGRYADYALFNFDFAYILAFNNEILEYMQGNNISGRLPRNLIQPNQDVTPVVYEKYQADTYGMYWEKPQQDEEGYYVYSTNTTKKEMQIKASTEYNPKINQKAGCEEIVFEVLEGSVSHGKTDQSLPFGKVRSIVNISTGEHKKVGDELNPGVYKSTSDYWRRHIYAPYIKAIQVPAKVRLISYSFKPYIAIAHLDCSRCYEGQHKVYDEIIGSTRQTTTNTKITPYSIHLNASTYKTKAPDRAPRFVGERWYNTETGDIYEAGNLSAFKKITP